MSRRDPASLVRHYADSTSPDRRTSMADARIALCIARGVDLDDIDPASGYNRSRDAYDRCRESWISNIRFHGFSHAFDGEGLRRAVATWTAHRPNFIASDDWLAEAEKAHLTYWEQAGLACNRPSCDFHAAA